MAAAKKKLKKKSSRSRKSSNSTLTVIILAAVLIFVINRRSFGWSMDLTLDPMLLLQSLLLAITAAMIAGMFPAFKMSRSNPVASLREE